MAQSRCGTTTPAMATTLPITQRPTVINGNNAQKALHFNGTSSFLSVPSLPIDGLSGMTVFVVSANAPDDTNNGCNDAFLYWPETAYWGATYFSTFESNARFRFGTTQVNNESKYSFTF